ncbi:MAG: alpha-amylase family glycosyl hydrolase [Nitrospiraceae bacterium]|nr:alpha-amylase family glycosyl hydrolase [Nitrospiraceae bacterium]
MRPGKMIIYNLFPLLAGKFTEWKSHLERASTMGFNWIFVNPVQRTGASGSLYSIADYFGLNPFFVDEKSRKGAADQLRDTIRVAERFGLRMMTDLVLNHCAVDSELLKKHPAWFAWEGKGKVAHPFAMQDGEKVVWYDLAKFDYRNSSDKEGLFRYALEVVEYLVKLGFKGMRCDAAYQAPRSFWERLIAETKERHPDVLFLAETLGSPSDLTRATASAGFDYIFNSSKWWDFTSPWLLEQYALTREMAPSISFPETHDTERLYEELGGNIDGMKQRYLFSALFSAGVMMPIGFEFGFRKRLHVANTKPSDWERAGVDLRSFIARVNGIKTANSIFQEDAPVSVLSHGNPNVLLLWKASIRTEQESLLILNKDINGKQNFYAESLQKFLQAGAPAVDISPEYPLDYIPQPFSYDLRPGQGIVLAAARDRFPEDVQL